MRLPAATLAAFALAALAAGCGPGGPDERAVLVGLADSVAVPGYEAAAGSAGALRQALDSLCAAPSEAALAGARQAWKDARGPWKRTEAAWFGPVMDRRSVGVIDWPEVEPERIETMLANNPVSSPDDVRYLLASTQRGFGAIEYLLFDGDAAEKLSSGPRCAYLAALGAVVESETAAVAEAWTTGTDGAPPYKDYLTGRASVSIVASDAVAEVVRTQVFLLRTIVDMRLASALGLREGGADPAALPGGAGRNALTDLRDEVLGMRDVYTGGGGEDALGVSALVSGLSADADERMRVHFQNSLAAIDGVGMPLRQALEERPDAVKAAYDRLSELQQGYNTEVVSLLGVSIGFSDTDGDSLR